LVSIAEPPSGNNVDGGTDTTTTRGFDMTQAAESKSVAHRSTDLLDEIRESAKVGQHAAVEALRMFRDTVDEAIPETVEPLRTKLIDAAVELADKLVAAQYQFNRNLIHSADRALSKSDSDPE
jgi:hypothetical protein